MSKEKKLLIIDGNAILHRSFHALPPTIKTKDGEIVNAVYGFASVLLKTITDFKPEYVALTFDKKGPTFRHEKYKEYKAHRKKAPDELYKQIPRIKELAKAFDIPVYEQSGFEADDLIGSIATNTEKHQSSIKNIVVTGDMDLLQLVNKKTEVYKLGRGIGDGIVFDKEKTIEKYSITPEQVVDYKALRGDASDNIPGVPGVGEKTTLALLKHFKTLDNIYKNIDSSQMEEVVKPRIINLLKEHQESAFLSYDLATIKCDVSMDFKLEDNFFNSYNREAVQEFFNMMEFKSLIPRLYDLDGKSLSEEKKVEVIQNKFDRNLKKFKYKLVETEKDFQEFYKKLEKQKKFTFDTETSGVDTMTCDLLGISFSWKEGEAYYLNLKNSNKSLGETPNLFNYQECAEESIHPWTKKLKTIFENKNIGKNAHNLKFDVKVLKSQGIKTNGAYFDTMLASYLINPETRQHSLDALTLSHFDFEKINKDDLLGTGKEKVSYGEVDTTKLGIYSAEDADFTNRLIKPLDKNLKEKNLFKLFNEIELPLIEVLVNMEGNGILLDTKFLSKMSKKLNAEIDKLEKKIHDLAGEVFNVRSTKQLKEILFTKLAIPTKGIKKTKTGFSTAFDELEKIKDSHPIITLIQEHRELSKLTSTYIDALPGLINKKTKRIHTHYNQTIAATGRLSSTNPNLQNIPTSSNLGKNIRKAFVAEKGYKLLAIDYSQIELRITAHLTNDNKMIKAFREGIDIHTQTAAEINKVNIEEVSREMRSSAKAINFGVLYGQGPHGLSQVAGISFAEAKQFIEDYFASFPSIRTFIDKTIEEAKKTESVSTMFGRSRKVSDINSTTPMIQKGAERVATNTPIQGTAADIMKLAMIKVYDKLKNKEDIKILLQVHDELVFEVKEELVEKYAQEIIEVMENVCNLKVKLVAEAKWGDNWGEMISLDV